MFNFIKNKFVFILALSIITLFLLIVGSLLLYKDESKSFSGDGYIISSTQKKNAKYYFSNNTKYKENVDKDIVFKDNDSKSRTISSQNFVHYLDGSIGFLTKGALVNLNEINSSALNYYNITSDNLLSHKNNSYSVNSNKGSINIESFMGRISDNKYIIAGKDLVLKLPNNDNKITGDYFEILFIENGIVKIDNQEASYQVTAQGTSISVGNNIIIDLGSGKISYNGEAKMLMSQLTINGDENINIDVDKKDNNGSGNNGGDGTDNTNDDNNNNQTNTTENNQNNQNNQNNNNNTAANNSNNNESKDKNAENGTGNGGGNGNATIENTAQIELIEAKSTATSLRLSFQLNNASAIKGNLIAILKNVGNGNTEYERKIDARNGTFSINKESLAPNTEYTLTITETTNKSEKQYFQKTFRTNDLGITLEKEYATSSSLAYNLNFDENSEVSKARIVIYDNSGSNETIETNSYIISANDISKVVEFKGLQSNSNYSVSVDTVWINNISYSDVYTINRIDTTLKQTPVLSDIKVTANAEEVKFNIKVNNIQDPDKGIQSYKYYVYKATDINLNNPNPEPVYTLTKNDADEIVLNLSEIQELKTGIDYRCKVVAIYDDNTMIREAASDYSKNFLIKTKPNIEWSTEANGTTMNSVKINMKLIDANCSVPFIGRSCLNKQNNLTLKYYPLGASEKDAQSLTGDAIRFNKDTLTSTVNITGLKSNTTYVLKFYGDYYDDNEQLFEDQQIGDLYYIKTDMSVNLKFKVLNDNESGKPTADDVVTFNAKLETPKDKENLQDEISKITFKLYSGSYNKEEKLIGIYEMNETNLIKSFFNNYNINNMLFKEIKEGDDARPIDKAKLKQLTNKLKDLTEEQDGTLNSTYTVEVAEVLDSAGVNKIYVEDNVYTFKLTPTYYLDERIRSDNSKYIVVDQIKKEDLLEDEYNELSRTINNLDDLNDDTIVGINIENRLSDIYVDSAFKSYEKVIVDYVVYNTVTGKEVKRESIDMGNKYQPKSKTIYLDPSDDENIEDPFVRGYKYKISYELKFITEDGENPIYRNDKLSKEEEINRQSPIYTQYISTSTANSITYRYSITDIDEALEDNKIYYSYKDNNDNKTAATEELIIDGENHNITIPLTDRKEYSIYLNEKNTKGTNTYVEINKNTFESEYNYDNEAAYSLIKDNDNLLKIKLLDNDVTNRAAAYKVTIKARDNSVQDYVRFFLASQLYTMEKITGIDEEGNEIKVEEKYIGIDYANIYQFMKKDLTVSVESYYDSGLVGFNQTFTNGLILKKYDEKDKKTKYLNIYNLGSGAASNEENDKLNGIYMQRTSYEQDSETMSLFNYLLDTNHYNKLNGTSYYLLDNLSQNIGIDYNLNYTNNGIVFINNKKEYTGYNAKLVKKDSLNTTNNNYRFDNIIPKVSLDSSKNTINSLNLTVNATGVYGQFIKDGQEHNVYYIDIYSDKELNNKITRLTSNITITDRVATSEEVKLENLKPDTTYYVTISAYVEGILTRLYDTNSTNGYVVKTYESKTLNAKSLVSRLDFKVSPYEYNGEYSNKKIIWRLNLSSTKNYKLRFELYDVEGNPVNFDGSPANNCNINGNGNSSNSYVSNCYIQVSQEDVPTIANKENEYIFTGNNFVFGDGYYSLKVYAIPYTNNSYVEEDKIALYDNEALSSSLLGSTDPVTGVTAYIDVRELEEADLDVADLTSGVRCKTLKDDEGNTKYENGNPICDSENEYEYYIEFKTQAPIDNSKVIKYGQYIIRLRNSNKEVIATKTNISAASIGKVITFVESDNNIKLSANSKYTIELDYDTYRNNVSLNTEEKKMETTPTTKDIYTPADKYNIDGEEKNIVIGQVEATQDVDNPFSKIVLTYEDSYGLEDVIKVVITIKEIKNNGPEQLFNTITITNDTIFEVVSDKKIRLTAELNNNKTLTRGNKYIIDTQYTLKNGYVIYDRITNKNTFETVLQL